MHDFDPLPLVNTNRKFILFINSKCGGTSLKSWFLQTLDVENTFCSVSSAVSNFGLRFVINWYLHWQRHSFEICNGKRILDNDIYLRHFITVHRESTRKMLPHIIRSPDWYKFAVVRNPYDRLVSAFVDKFCGPGLMQPWVQSVIRDVGSDNDDGKPGINFIQFIEYLEGQDMDSTNRHWRRQSYILESVKLDRLVNLDRLADELPAIEQQLGLPHINLKSARQSNVYEENASAGLSFVGNLSNTRLMEYRDKTGAFPVKRLFYNDNLRSRVHELYRDDFELLPA
jgi:hypothetical protein